LELLQTDLMDVHVLSRRSPDHTHTHTYNMGGRLSKPKAPDGMSEAPKPATAEAAARLSRSRGIINGRVRLKTWQARAWRSI
jgi:hypothetical protein